MNDAVLRLRLSLRIRLLRDFAEGVEEKGPDKWFDSAKILSLDNILKFGAMGFD